jgi:hypothetical protein
MPFPIPLLPKSGDGYQIGDGNVAELKVGAMAAPVTFTATATLTVLALAVGLVIGNPSTTAATYTMPTGAQLDIELGSPKVGTTFEFMLINLGTGAGVITLAPGAGNTLVGLTTLPTAAAGSSAVFLLRKTGVGAYTIYRKS